MNVNRDANGFVVLDRRACLDRLAQRRVAALAITDHALPVVLPALYTLRDDDVLVGAASSGILGRRMPDSVVSLCVHDLDDDLLNGWTVTVTGLAEVVTSPADLAAAAELRRWGAGEAAQVVVRIGTEHISGRLIHASHAASSSD
jgi:nitroimidazol reductase NimA-like FMN-containing flavoprotein (pyridoxamine 5'-phosphate oxidase superfamily)